MGGPEKGSGALNPQLQPRSCAPAHDSRAGQSLRHGDLEQTEDWADGGEGQVPGRSMPAR